MWRRSGSCSPASVLDLALSLAASWARDLAATSAGAEEVVFNVDRLEVLREQSRNVSMAAARKAGQVTVSIDDDGTLVEIAPDGSRRPL